MPALPLSEEQLADAKRLKGLFQEWQRTRRNDGRPSSQEAAAEELGFGQSALAQYLNGKIPLNLSAGKKFADLMGVQMDAFSPALAKEASQFAGPVTHLVVTSPEEDHLRVESPRATYGIEPAPANNVVLTREEYDRLVAAQSVELQWLNTEERRLLTLFRGVDEDNRRRALVLLERMPRLAKVGVVGN